MRGVGQGGPKTMTGPRSLGPPAALPSAVITVTSQTWRKKPTLHSLCHTAVRQDSTDRYRERERKMPLWFHMPLCGPCPEPSIIKVLLAEQCSVPVGRITSTWTAGFPSMSDYSAILQKWSAHVPPSKLLKPCTLSEGGQGPLIKQIVRGPLNCSLPVTPASEGLSVEAGRTTWLIRVRK